MALILLPFSLMASLVTWESQIRITAGILVVIFGIYLLINRRHPRILARIPPSKISTVVFFSRFGAWGGIDVGPDLPRPLCTRGTNNESRSRDNSNGRKYDCCDLGGGRSHLGNDSSRGFLALLMYLWLGLKFLSKTFFNLDIVWALSLVLVGAFRCLFCSSIMS